MENMENLTLYPTKPMTNKAKLKTFEEVVRGMDQERWDNGEPHDTYASAWKVNRYMFDAHHSYLLHLEERIEELEKKLLNK